MRVNLRLSLLLVGVFAAVVAALAVIADSGRKAPAPVTGAQASALVVRPDSNRLNRPAAPAATLVEFLDFECEACRAAFPVVEQLRKQYGDRVEFVTRYFPIPSHTNAMNAAVAVQAASQQNAYERMYARMYQTQAQWGESRDSKAALFRTFAQDLQLNLAAYDAAVADPATRARVQRDVDDGIALGVQGTPTFFLDGKQLELTSFDDLTRAVAGAARG